MSENKKNCNKVRMFPISIVLFLMVGAVSAGIILNKGKIGNYSLVNIDSTNSEQTVENKKKYNSDSVMELSVDKKFLSAKTNEEKELKLTIDGEEIDLSEAVFESSNDEIVTVNENGIITAISTGKATITANVEDLTASVDVRAIIPVTSMSFTSTSSTVRVGKSLQMKLITTPSSASIETLKYSSSDESIATVNSNGIVTGVSSGKVTITVTDLYTETEKSVNLTILK